MVKTPIMQALSPEIVLLSFSRAEEVLYGSMLNENLNDLNSIQHAFNRLWTIFTLSTMLDDLCKRPQHLVQQSFERMLSRMLKPFERAFTYCSRS